MFTERFSYWSGLTLAAALAVGGARTARAADSAPAQPGQQELLDKVNALQSEVQQLKQIAQRQEAAEQRDEANNARLLQQDAQRADQIQLLQAGGFTSGYDDGRFLLQSPDKNYVLHPWLQLQFRYESTYRDDVQHGGNDPDTQSGFEIRRLKLGFDGNVITPDLTYLFQFAIDRKTGVFSLEQAFAKYHINGSPFYLKAGQYKEPLDHEQLLASRFLTAVDRTFTNDLFTNSEGFVQGASIGFEGKAPYRAEVAFTDGQRSGNTNFQQFPVGANTADWGVAGRGEYKLFGRWKDYDKSTGAYGAKGDFLAVGAGADYTEAGDTHTFTHVADFNYGTESGFAVYGAYTGRAFTHAAIGSFGSNGGTTKNAVGTNGYDWSLRGQVSYAIDKHWEPYAQYEFIHLDGNNAPAGIKNNFQILRAGVNYYLLGADARLTFDASYLPEGSPVNDDGLGILATGAATKTSGYSHGGGNEIIFRAQLQLAL